MGHHLFQIIDNHDWSSIDGPATIVKNMTVGPFVIDDEGRSLHSMGVAAVDESCNKCAEGIKSGKLIVLDKVGGSKSAKSKAKSVAEPKQQTESTVASPEDNDSVQ